MNERGRKAEARAAVYLEQHGLRILEKNWRCRFGEIDIVANDGRTLVFVEVRSRSAKSYGGAAESIDAGKRGKLVAAATQYLTRIGLETPCRFDAVLIDASGSLEWVRNAFGTD